MNSFQQAIAAHQSAKLPEAESLYRATLREQPDNADALALLGLVLGTMGRNDEGLFEIDRAIAIDPRASLFRFHRGSVLMNAKRLPEAAEAFRQALARQPDFAPAHYNLANALRAMEDWDGAMASYRLAIKHNPKYGEAFNNFALSLVHEKQLHEALEAAKQAVEVEPSYGEGWRTLCNIAEQVKNYPLALAAGEKCIALMPDSHFAWFGYGVALNRSARHLDAIEAYIKALRLKPDRADIWDNIGQTYQSLGLLDEAEQAFRHGVIAAGQEIAGEGTREIAEEEYGNRHWHLSLLELLRGKYVAGFARYRSRFKDIGKLKRPSFVAQLWRGEDLRGKSIIVYDEQGFGDTLMLARYLPLLKAQGARVTFRIHKVLEPLFRGWPEADRIATHDGAVEIDTPGPHDYFTSVFDLPYRLGTTLDNIPSADRPYLPAPALLTPELTLPPTDKKRIGVVWGGSPLHSNDSKRSVPLPIFAEIFAEPGAEFFNFNRDLKDGDKEKLPALRVTDLVPLLKDFAAAAQLIGQMDLIITCDTATAHLAGGLGKNVWVLLPFAPDWRWLADRTDSVWYANFRLFRQPSEGDWQSCVNAVKQALPAFISSL